MQRYLQQLIEDLEEAVKHPPALPFIEPPPHLENLQFAAELALVPFKPIAEWTGIDENVFPAMYLLSGELCDYCSCEHPVDDERPDITPVNDEDDKLPF